MFGFFFLPGSILKKLLHTGNSFKVGSVFIVLLLFQPQRLTATRLHLLPSRSDVMGSVSSCCGCRPFGTTVPRSSSLSLPVWCQDSPPCPPPEGPAPSTPSFTTPSLIPLMVNMNVPTRVMNDVKAQRHFWSLCCDACGHRGRLSHTELTLRCVGSFYFVRELSSTKLGSFVPVDVSSQGGAGGDYPAGSGCSRRKGCRWPDLLRPRNPAQVHGHPGNNGLCSEEATQCFCQIMEFSVVVVTWISSLTESCVLLLGDMVILLWRAVIIV